MEPECTLYLDEESASVADMDSKTMLHWTALSMRTPIVPFLVEQVVHAAPANEQFGRLLGLACWLLDKDISVLFNVQPAPAGGIPAHATLMWHDAIAGHRSRLGTANMPPGADQEMWKRRDNGKWERLVQPDQARYNISSELVPDDNYNLLWGAFSKWMLLPDAPVVLMDCKLADSQGILRRHHLDVSTWIASLPEDDLHRFMEDCLNGQRSPLLVDMLDRNSLLALLPTMERVSTANPSAHRIARRQSLLLQANTPQTRSAPSRRL